MIELRPFAELGHFQHDWLTARHHFSFGHYRDPRRMGFGRPQGLERRHHPTGERFRPP